MRVTGIDRPLFLETTEQATPLNAVVFRSKLQQGLFSLSPGKENKLKAVKKSGSQAPKKRKVRKPGCMFAIV